MLTLDAADAACFRFFAAFRCCHTPLPLPLLLLLLRHAAINKYAHHVAVISALIIFFAAYFRFAAFLSRFDVSPFSPALTLTLPSSRQHMLLLLLFSPGFLRHAFMLTTSQCHRTTIPPQYTAAEMPDFRYHAPCCRFSLILS